MLAFNLPADATWVIACTCISVDLLLQPCTSHSCIPLQDYYHAPPASGDLGPLARDYYLSQGATSPGTGLRDVAGYDSAIAAGDASDANHNPATFICYAISIFLTMGVSLAVWPGVTAFFCSVDNPATSSPCAPRGDHAGIWGRLTGDLFVPVTFVAFGLGDLFGRIASSWGPWGRRPPAAASLLLYAVLRFAIAAGILCCNVVTPTPWKLPVLVNTDWASLGLIFLLGLTQVLHDVISSCASQ